MILGGIFGTSLATILSQPSVSKKYKIEIISIKEIMKLKIQGEKLGFSHQKIEKMNEKYNEIYKHHMYYL